MKGGAPPTTPASGTATLRPIGDFQYTFDRIAAVDQFTDQLGLDRYTLVVQDYGGPVGMRLALRRPERVSALVVQNAVCHEDGLGPRGKRDGRSGLIARHDAELRENFFSGDATRRRHVRKSPEPDRYDPDLGPTNSLS
ncbi:MAG: alpha/beta fold hydrolase [Mycobacteriaceae bacterium]|nr:alpha/beta fold hydrolase [Mycobacteriaceae bacterium]MBV9641480.1 alpha/beta fold hydrolase [Mycobacteriaceae bacterium]